MNLQALFTVEYNVPVHGTVKRRYRLRQRAWDAVTAALEPRRSGRQRRMVHASLTPTPALSRLVWMTAAGLATAMLLIGLQLTSDTRSTPAGRVLPQGFSVSQRVAVAAPGPAVAPVVIPATTRSVQPLPAQPVELPRHMDEDVRQAVVRWAEAWSRRDVTAYLGAYADHYAGPSGDRNNWERERRNRIESRRLIRVELSDVEVETGPTSARVTFVQRYRSEAWQETTRKTLTLERDAQDRWLIVRET